MYESLQIIRWPDARLKKRSEVVTAFDDKLAALASRMLELMRDAKGVGLAAPQVGINLRLFVLNHSGEAGDDFVVVNPRLTAVDGDTWREEGCLSLPDIHIDVLRADTVRLEAQDLAGQPFSRTHTGFIPRIWQHETDHLDGILLTDRMTFSDRMKHRRALRDLEAAAKPARPRLQLIPRR